jgi:plasmid maintenance system antidote protein VapI
MSKIATCGNPVTGILNTTHPVTADSAFLRDHPFRTRADFWMKLQMIYDLPVAEAALAATPRPRGSHNVSQPFRGHRRKHVSATRPRLIPGERQ